MNKFLAILFTLLFISSQLSKAQDSVSIPDSRQGWDTAWTVGLNGSQASYSNWSQGGVNSIAATGNSVFTSVYQEGRYSYGFLFSSRYGKTKIENEGTQKISDQFFIVNRFLYDLSEGESDFSAFLNIKFRSQFDKGFDYNVMVDGEERDVLISRFLAPAYFNQNAGIAYIPNDHYSLEAGLGLQQTYIRDEDLSETYGLQPGDQFRFEAGLTFGAEAKLNLAKNVRFTTDLQTFTSFNDALDATDIYFSNELVGKVNDNLNTNLRLDLVYDKDFTDEIQVAQVLSLGLAYTLR